MINFVCQKSIKAKNQLQDEKFDASELRHVDEIIKDGITYRKGEYAYIRPKSLE